MKKQRSIPCIEVDAEGLITDTLRLLSMADTTTGLCPKRGIVLTGLLPPDVDGQTILIPANADDNRPASSTYGSLNV